MLSAGDAGATIKHRGLVLGVWSCTSTHPRFFMIMGYCVYKHTAPNGKVYIGVTSRPPKQRWGNNGSGYKDQMFYRAIVKYGWDNIEHDVLCYDLTKDEAEEMEKRLIFEYNSSNKEHGYNLDMGGSLGKKMSDESKRKMSVAAKNRISTRKGAVLSEETKKKISEHRKGIPSWNSGKHGIFSKESLEKMSKNARRYYKGKHLPEETRKKIGDALRGRTYPKKKKDVIPKIKEKRKSNKFAIENRARGHMKQVLCVETNTVFASIKEAWEKTKIDASSITAVCKRKRKTAGGYRWMYYEGVNHEK